jgi:hypothetical protein
MIALLAVVAGFAGTVDAIAGGGGLITLPALLAAGLPPHVAIATNKGQATWGSAASSISYWRAGLADRKLARLTWPLGAAGAVGGTQLVLLLSPDALRPVVIAMLIGASVLLFLHKPTRDADDPDLRARRFSVACLLAFAIGSYDGFFGPGTGTFLVVGFVALCGRSLIGATADAKVVNFAANLAALVAFAIAGNVVWRVALPMAVGQLAGGVFGARLAMRGGARLVRIGIVVVSGALIVKLVAQLIAP